MSWESQIVEGAQITPGVPSCPGGPNKPWGSQIVQGVPNKSQRAPKGPWGTRIVMEIPRSCNFQLVDSLSLFLLAVIFGTVLWLLSSLVEVFWWMVYLESYNLSIIFVIFILVSILRLVSSCRKNFLSSLSIHLGQNITVSEPIDNIL